jgi:predicted AAA+ superfamily ATPase
MVPRQAAKTLARLARVYPVVAITGPRQSGKTTLARAAFPRKPYASLEDPDTREFAETDPRRFLGQYPSGAVLDEAQRCPPLFSYLQGVVDARPRRARFVLTGSAQFGLLAGISQSLAGRVGLLQLLPFSLDELRRKWPPPSLEAALWRGGYPPIFDRRVPPAQWYADYLVTYVERDVRQLVNVRDLAAFRLFVRLCAARTAQIVNLSSLGSDCGVTHNTARAWLSLLEASYLVFLLPPYHRNYGKRLVKAPKLYFYDAGFAAWLAGVRSERELALSALRGPLFETWAVSECLKQRANFGQPAEPYFWRDSAGHEVDLLVEAGGTLRALEFKAGATIAGDWFAPLHRFRALSGAASAALVHGGGAEPHVRGGIRVYDWRNVGRAARAALA